MTLIARNTDFEWLERESRWSSLIFLTGVKGIGKTTLIKEWIQKRTGEKKCVWLNISRYRDLPSLLQNQGASPETALDQFLPTLKAADIVVWDDLHLLNPSAKKALLAFLQNTPLLPLQILLSDEEIDTHELDGNFGHRRLTAFSREETEQFLRSFSTDPIKGKSWEESTSFALQVTGGIPLLLKHLLQHGNAPKEFEKILTPLQADIRELFDAMILLCRPLSGAEGLLLYPKFETAITELLRKCLVEKTGDGSLYIVPSPVRSLCLHQFSAEKKQRLAALLCERFQKNFLPFEYAFLALRSGVNFYIEQALNHELIDRLEHLCLEDLREFSQILKEETPELVPLKERLLLRSLLVLGLRAEAIEISHRSIDSLKNSSAWTQDQEFLLLEIVQIHNRAGRTEEARRLISLGLERAREALKPLLQVEEAVSFLATDHEQAKRLLLPALAHLQRDGGSILTLAQANFQLARAYDLLDQSQEAELHYSLALDAFQRCDKPYFGAVALLNLGWLALGARNWPALAKVKEKLSPLCSRFGYAYVQAGLAILEASEARLALRCGEALSKIEFALQALGNHAPLPARVDAFIEQIRILLNLGLRNQAEKSIATLRTLVANHPTLQSRLRSLLLEVRAEKEASEAWLESSHALSPTSDCVALFHAYRGVQLGKDDEKIFKAHTLGSLARMERALTDALLNNERENAWSMIARMEKILVACGEARPEKISLLLLEASLSENPEEKLRFFDRAELELQRWGADETVKAPLRAWLESVKENRSPQTHPQWQKSSIGDQERWKRWWISFDRTKKQGWILYSEEGIRESEERPVPTKSTLLYVVEHLAEVRWNGTAIDEFVRRHALRKLLCLLLENPHGVDKPSITSLVWGESYDPLVHDARIYTSVQRLRAIFGQHDAVQNWDRGYRWNPSIRFLLVRPRRENFGAAETRCQNLILQALDQSTKSGRQWVARGELVEITKSSEATVKRELAKLLSSSLIHRQGKGRAVVYSARRGIA